MPLDKRSPFRSSLLAAPDAALPLQHGPPVKTILRQLGKYSAEIHLAISRRTKPSCPVHPGLIASVNALAARWTKLRVLHVKHSDALVIQIEEFKIIELLQHEMTRVKQHLAPWMISGALQKHFERDTIVQIFAGMDLEAQIHSRFVKCIEDGTPARGQLFKSSFNQPGRPLWPRIDVRPRQRPGKCHMRRKPQVGGRSRRQH